MTALLFLLLPLQAHSASESYCVPLALVHQRVDYCFQNSNYVEQADLCLKKFDDDVLTTKNQLANRFVAHDKASVLAQNSKLNNSGSDLKDTNRSLNGLLQRARKARQELVAYSQSLIFPGDPFPSLVSYYNLSNHLATFPCFQENFLLVTDKIAGLDRKIAELSRTNADTASLLKDTSSNVKKLDLTAKAPVPASRTLASGAAVKQGQAPRAASTITGEIKKQPR